MGKEDGSWRARNRIYIIPIVLALVAFMLVAPEKIEGDAMEPTIFNGSIVVLTKDSFSVKRGAPKLGSVVVLEKNVAKNLSEDNIVARVVGLPGDEIEIKEGKLYRNKKEYEVSSSVGKLKDELKVKIGENEVFLLCDNRDEKIDSRADGLGSVNMKDIKGTVKLVIWPLSDFGGIN